MANSTPFPAQLVEVQNNVHQQIASIAETLDSILLKTPRKRDVPEAKVWQSGLSFALGGVPPPPRYATLCTFRRFVCLISSHLLFFWFFWFFCLVCLVCFLFVFVVFWFVLVSLLVA